MSRIVTAVSTAATLAFAFATCAPASAQDTYPIGRFP